ncbi:MAG: hypothetical protein NC911_05015, partial [Candidatus Omnitrophica bacterium]|nr:hypothetical protein [Candidatus Omnitrophota bacterium]
FPWSKFESLYDPVVYAYMRNLANYYAKPSRATLGKCLSHLLRYKERFDILFISFILLRHFAREGLIEFSTLSEAERNFLSVTKLWDFMEPLEQPIEETLNVINSLFVKVGNKNR